MRGTASARSNAEARAGSIARSLPLEAKEPMETSTSLPSGQRSKVGAEREVAGEGWQVRRAPLGRVRVSPPDQSWTALSFVYSESTTTEGCHGTKLD